MLVVHQVERLATEAQLSLVPHGVESEVVILGATVEPVSGWKPPKPVLVRLIDGLLVRLGKKQSAPASASNFLLKFCRISGIELLEKKTGDGRIASANQTVILDGLAEMGGELNQMGITSQRFINIRGKIFPNGRLYVRLEEPILV